MYLSPSLVFSYYLYHRHNYLLVHSANCIYLYYILISIYILIEVPIPSLFGYDLSCLLSSILLSFISWNRRRLALRWHVRMRPRGRSLSDASASTRSRWRRSIACRRKRSWLGVVKGQAVQIQTRELTFSLTLCRQVCRLWFILESELAILREPDRNLALWSFLIKPVTSIPFGLSNALSEAYLWLVFQKCCNTASNGVSIPYRAKSSILCSQEAAPTVAPPTRTSW